MGSKRRPPRRGGRPKGRAEQRYIGIRTLFSPTNFDAFLNDERYDQTILMALHKQFGENRAETLAGVKITGYLETFKKNLKFHATREDMKRFFMLVEKNRYDKKFAITKKEAFTRFMSDKAPRSISKIRPPDYEAKPTTLYRPRKGSATGKVEVKQIGFVKTEQALKEAMKALFTMMEGIVKPQGKVSKSVTVKKR